MTRKRLEASASCHHRRAFRRLGAVFHPDIQEVGDDCGLYPQRHFLIRHRKSMGVFSLEFRLHPRKSLEFGPDRVPVAPHWVTDLGLDCPVFQAWVASVWVCFAQPLLRVSYLCWQAFSHGHWDHAQRYLNWAAFALPLLRVSCPYEQAF
jgi:hypothetical protein